jgi:hypothetical protein
MVITAAHSRSLAAGEGESKAKSVVAQEG